MAHIVSLCCVGEGEVQTWDTWYPSAEAALWFCGRICSEVSIPLFRSCPRLWTGSLKEVQHPGQLLWSPDSCQEGIYHHNRVPCLQCAPGSLVRSRVHSMEPPPGKIRHESCLGEHPWLPARADNTGLGGPRACLGRRHHLTQLYSTWKVCFVKKKSWFKSYHSQCGVGGRALD